MKNEYPIIKENNNKNLYTLILGILVVGGLIFKIIEDEVNRNIYIGCSLFAMAFLILYQGFRPRYCPYCSKKMKMDNSNGLPPEYYYCDSCKVQVKTFIKRDYNL